MTSFVNGGGRVVVDLWTIAPVELEEVCGGLADLLSLAPFLHDAENVWEWGYTHEEEARIEINATRKHDDDDEPLFEEPIRVMLLIRNDIPKQQETLLRDKWVPKLGEALAIVTGQTVYVGAWEYLSGDDFALRADRQFAPHPADIGST